jgi:hypothetical protein
LLQTFNFTGPLVAEQNGTPGTAVHTETVTVPEFVAGNKYVIIRTGVNENFFEQPTTNNTTASSSTVYIPPSLLVSLVSHSVLESASDPDSKGNIPAATTGTITRPGEGRHDPNLNSVLGRFQHGEPAGRLHAVQDRPDRGERL